MHTYLIALGSNLGDRKYYLDEAISHLRSHCGKVLAIADTLESEPIGAADQAFYNSALTLETNLEPEAMLRALLDIEEKLGRVRKERWGNRTIDLDIILWKSGSEARTYQSATLSIPHPETLKRDFVMIPSLSIAGDWIHPQIDQSLEEYWSTTRKSGV